MFLTIWAILTTSHSIKLRNCSCANIGKLSLKLTCHLSQVDTWLSKGHMKLSKVTAMQFTRFLYPLTYSYIVLYKYLTHTNLCWKNYKLRWLDLMCNFLPGQMCHFEGQKWPKPREKCARGKKYPKLYGTDQIDT